MNHNCHEPHRGKSSEVRDDTEDLQLFQGWVAELFGSEIRRGWMAGWTLAQG